MSEASSIEFAKIGLNRKWTEIALRLRPLCRPRGWWRAAGLRNDDQRA